jgi:hypothetical protein
LTALATEVARSTTGVPCTGIAAIAARAATVAASVPLRDADEDLSLAAGALRRYASELEEAQKEAGGVADGWEWAGNQGSPWDRARPRSRST